MEQHTLKVLEFDKIISKLKAQAACSLGREVAALTFPTTDIEVARRMQKETSEARAILDYEGNIPLGGLTDIRKFVERSSVGSLLQPEELLSVQSTLRASKRLGQFLVKLRDKYPLLGDLASEIDHFDHIDSAIAGAISSNAEVMDSASQALARARTELRSAQSRITEKMNSYLQGSYRTIIQDPVITIRSDRYCIPIKAEHRGQFPGIVHDASTSGATLFIEPAAVVELGNKRRQLIVKEREEVEKVLARLTGMIGECVDRIMAMLNVVGMIDCIAARAKLGIAFKGTEAFLNDNGQIEIISGRHPLLTGEVVPIDITLGKTFNALLITGPNTGGKTVSLKTLGLFCLMAASGLQIPASPGTELAIYDNIYADIGDEQSIEQSLSTFSSHLNNIVRITRGAGSNSLVLMDEVGAGTDPAEGAALAKAILDFLLAKGAKIVATTHYGELKEFAYMREGVENASVEFDPISLRPTYRLMIGVPGSSNAFAIAARLGLDSAITDAAKTNLSTHTESSDELIRQIEESHRVVSEQRKIAEQKSAEAEELRNRYQKQLGGLDSARERAERQAKSRAESVVESYSQRLDETLEALAAQKPDTKRAQDLKKKVEKLVEKMEENVVKPMTKENRDEAFPKGTAFSVGARVGIANVNHDGEIAESPQGGKVVVMVGNMRVTVPVSALRKPQGASARELRSQPNESRISFEKAKDFKQEIHLRGMRVEAALEVLDKYMDDAMAAGAESMRIVHGKGTGQLRLAVWEFLKHHLGVLSYKIGEQDEGGFGVTIVQMK
ncbi:MAG: endonuclease MutS2 [Armatimonadetes bacterium]|nr:endonuclease MutS2 [Armatimonadota bacterium]